MKFKSLLFAAASVAVLALSSCGDNKPKPLYEESWDSIRENYSVPEWFRDAKLGIFLVWGPYSVPAYGTEKYGKYMYAKSDPKFLSYLDLTQNQYHKEHYGDQKEFGYKDFFPMFTAEKFNADEWVADLMDAGARYIMPIAEFHDGYAMYDSSYTRWNSVETGPKRDIIKELQDACKRADVKFGATSHLAKWRGYYNTWDENYDTYNPEYQDLYWQEPERGKPASQKFLDMWWNRTSEIMDNYELDLIWFDFGLDSPDFAPYHKKMLAHFYNRGVELGKEVVFQDKNMSYPSFPEDLITLDLERGRMSEIFKYPWQTDTSIGTISWGNVSNEIYKSPELLIDELVDIVSKNGNMLLAIGPQSDGTFSEKSKEVLAGIGAWLKVNGEAIYDTRPWKIYGEGPTEVATGNHTEKGNAEHVAEDIRFTQNGDLLYATSLAWSPSGNYNITSLKSGNSYESRPVKSVSFISGANPISWEQDKDGLKIKVQGEAPCIAAYSFKIEF